jgi:hypothetical protein
MGLPWVRLDTSMPGNPKILHLIESHKEGRAAAFVWLCSIAYAGQHLTDGFLTRSALGRVNGTALHARLLVQHGFWQDEAGVGWTINNFAEYQQANLTDAEERSRKARNAAFKRWGKEVPDDAP